MRRKRYACDLRIMAFQVREAEGPPVKSGSDFAEMFKDISCLDKEAFFVVTLSQKNSTIDRHLVSMGTLTASLVHPREAFRPALQDGAAAVAFVHNHPSGDPTPSSDDMSLTKRLKDAADLLGIRILDHVIVGRGRYFSFVDEGLL